MPLLDGFAVDHTGCKRRRSGCKAMNTPHGDTDTVFDLRLHSEQVMPEKGFCSEASVLLAHARPPQR